MRTKAILPALALIACLAAPATSSAGEQQRILASLGDQDAAAQPAPDSPAPQDKELVREHELFSAFAHMQVERMNNTIIGGRRQMHVYRGSDGLYHASYRAIDLPGVVCLVRRSESSPGFYVGNLIYKEQVLESTGKSAAACKRGPFEPVSEKSSRLIYTSRRGGGWY